MLTEIKTLQQRETALRKRWFNDANFDLFVWHRADGSVCRFELCYDKQYVERAIRWDARQGIQCFEVDSGESGLHYKMAPLMRVRRSEGGTACEDVAAGFRDAARGLDPAIVAIVCARLGAPAVRLV